MGTDDPARKAAVRREVRERRRAMPDPDRRAAAAALTERLAALAGDLGARRIASYAPRPDEPDVSGFTAHALAAGLEILLPVSQGDRSLAWAHAHESEHAPGLHGILEPAGDRLPPETIRTADLVLVPACAVDHGGTRLGWGLGYYDRALALLEPGTPVYAVVFDEDVCPALPREPHDAPITGVVTPGGLRVFPGTTG